VATLAVILRIESRDVPADDFLGRVALEPLSSPVPARDTARRVQQEDGVVLHSLHEHGEKVAVVRLSLRAYGVGQGAVGDSRSGIGLYLAL
jgi:hypothetical protein